jgi:hypothetical protein
MIPTLLVVGFLAGRWYVIPLAAVVWPLVLVLLGIESDAADLFVAAGLAAANTAVGVLVHQGAKRLLAGLARLVRGPRPSA